MKTKLKKWHIALMSFVALMLAIFTSLFNLKADPVDDETGEILTDNWELGVVFYDSTVDNGKTPLTEINWDASDNSYSYGTQRVITVQINYKNNSAVTTYQPGEYFAFEEVELYNNYIDQTPVGTMPMLTILNGYYDFCLSTDTAEYEATRIVERCYAIVEYQGKNYYVKNNETIFKNSSNFAEWCKKSLGVTV